MRKGILVALSLLLIAPITTWGQQPSSTAIEDYIQKYKGLAISEQIRTQVPAAITLAQGIYETGAGQSELCKNAHNHFGIKCKKSWQGDTYFYDDDRKQECFRKYDNARQSYIDHSDFLRNNPRYNSLFNLATTNYKGWAKGLQRKGYATNPHYAQRLIKYIKQYYLEQYTDEAIKDQNYASKGITNKEQTPQKHTVTPLMSNGKNSSSQNKTTSKITIANTTKNSWWPPVDWDTVQFYKLRKKNGLQGFYAKKGDYLLKFAVNHKIKYGRLLLWNNLPDAPLEANMFIYLESKKQRGQHAYYIVRKGQDLLQISQATGVDLDRLRLLNQLKHGEQPAAGTRINLQTIARHKPKVVSMAQKKVARKNKQDHQPKLPSVKKSNPDYISITHAEENQEATVISSQSKPVINQVPQRENTREKEPVINQDKVASQGDKTAEQKAQKFAQKETQRLHSNNQTTSKPIDSSNNNKPLSSFEKLRLKMNKIVYGKQGMPPGSDTQSVVKPTNKTNTVKNPVNEKFSKDKIKDYPPRPFPNHQTSKGTKKRLVNPTKKLNAYMDTVKQKTYQEPKPVNKSHTVNSLGQKYYTVKSGDTAFSIAKRFGISLKQLQKWNHLPRSLIVKRGQRLRVR